MPQYRTHIFGGAIAFGLLWLLLLGVKPSLGTSVEWLFFAVLGSLFPDVDITSKGQKIFFRLLALVFIYYVFQQNIINLSIIGAIALFPLLVRHRGIFHRVWFIFLLGLITITWTYFCFPRYKYLVAWDVAFFTVGALSHIWLDLGIKRMMKYK